MLNVEPLGFQKHTQHRCEEVLKTKWCYFPEKDYDTNFQQEMKQEKDLKKTLNVLHQSLFKNDFIQLHLYIAGVGAIGSKLLSMIDSQTNYLASQKIQLKLCGCCNSKQMIINDYDLNFNNWKNKLNESRINKNLTEFTEMMIIQNLENSVFIDVTASNEPIEYYNKLLQ